MKYHGIPSGIENRFMIREYDVTVPAYRYNIYEWDPASGCFLRIKGPVYPEEESDTDNNTQESSKTFSFEADLTHDGSMDTIIVNTGRVAEEQTAVTSVVNEYGETLWNNEAATAHAGWNSIYLTTVNYSWLDGGGIAYESQELLDKLIKFKKIYSE